MSQPKLNDFEIEIIEPSTSISTEDIEIVESDSTDNIIVAEVELPRPVEISEEEASTTPIEYTEWESGADFENYILASARKIPPVFEGSKNSFKRAFTYLEKLSEEITNGVQQDAPYSDLTEDQLRSLDLVEEGIENALVDISASIQGKLTKTATKSSNFVYYVNPFIFGLARILVNGKVSQGKNIETLYAGLDKTYKLNEREQLELYFILNDMGHPIASSFVNHADRAEQYQT